MSDLIARLRDPEEVRAAFTQVIALYTEPLYWQIRRMVQNHDDANDLLQNVFMKHGRRLIIFAVMPDCPHGFIKSPLMSR